MGASTIAGVQHSRTENERFFGRCPKLNTETNGWRCVVIEAKVLRVVVRELDSKTDIGKEISVGSELPTIPGGCQKPIASRSIRWKCGCRVTGVCFYVVALINQFAFDLSKQAKFGVSATNRERETSASSNVGAA